MTRRPADRRTSLLAALAMAMGPAVALAAACAGPASANDPEDVAAADRLKLLDSSVIAASVVAISPAGAVSGPGIDEPLALDRILEIERRSVARVKPTGATLVELVGGGRIFAASVALRDDKCAIAWRPPGPVRIDAPPSADSADAGAPIVNVELPIERVRAILFPPEDAEKGHSATLFKSLETPAGDADVFLFKDGDAIQSVPGFIEEIAGERIVFERDGSRREVPRANLLGIVMARLGDPPDRTGQALAQLADGSSMWGKVESLADGRLELATTRGGRVAFPWESVRGLEIRSARLVYLSDIEPVGIVYEPIVALPRRWRRDVSVTGAPLSLRGQTFSKGLGVPSGSRLAYDVPAGFDHFAATIGIDAQTGGRGNCVFVVLADGNERYRQEVTGRDAPRNVRLPIAGAKRITLSVEPGEDLDLADHADWCDARLIRLGE
jgi:hypothetical protein